MALYTYDSLYNVSSVESLEGSGLNVGGSASIPIPETPIAGYGGVEVNIVQDKKANLARLGLTRKRGIAVPANNAAVDGSITGGNTWTTESLNVFDFLKGIFD